MEYKLECNLDANEVKIANNILRYAPLKGPFVSQPTLFWAVKLASIVDLSRSRAERLYEILGYCISCQSWAEEMVTRCSSINDYRSLEFDEFLVLQKWEKAYARYSLEARKSALRATEFVAYFAESISSRINFNRMPSRIDLSHYCAAELLRKGYTALTAEIKALGL
jgi:hypothetical protein